MFLARVVGDVIATHRHGELAGRKLLLVRRLSLEGDEVGAEVVALDVIGVGVGERVLVVQEGGAARTLSGSARVPAQAVVVGVVDRVDLVDEDGHDTNDVARADGADRPDGAMDDEGSEEGR